MSVAENRGSLAKKSKALDIRVFGIRNRLEDQHLELKYVSTVEMVADFGTKKAESIEKIARILRTPETNQKHVHNTVQFLIHGSLAGNLGGN